MKGGSGSCYWNAEYSHLSLSSNPPLTNSLPDLLLCDTRRYRVMWNELACSHPCLFILKRKLLSFTTTGYFTKPFVTGGRNLLTSDFSMVFFIKILALSEFWVWKNCFRSTFHQPGYVIVELDGVTLFYSKRFNEILKIYFKNLKSGIDFPTFWITSFAYFQVYWLLMTMKI